MQMEPITPFYNFSTAPELVSLLDGKAEYCYHRRCFSGEGSVQLKFFPSPMIVLQGFTKSPNWQESITPKQSKSADADGVFIFKNNEIDIFFLSSNENKNELQANFTPCYEPLFLESESSNETVEIIAHLFNFPNFWPVQNERTEAFGAAVVFLESDDWMVVIQALPNKDTFKQWDKIKSQGGCFLTHMVKLARLDGQPFSKKDAEAQLEMLSCFLSFAKGQRLSTVCEVGLDNKGFTTWRRFASPRLTDTPTTWFTLDNGAQLEELFPLFSRKWNQSKEWKETLTYAVSWYAQANMQKSRQITLDTAIIFIQAAWERLAYQHIVNERGMMSSEGYKGLKFAADKFRMLFSNLGIPTEIQDSTPAIQKTNWGNSPRAFVEIRNSLVHPKTKNEINNDCYIEAWKLGLWCLELSILGVCDYQGTYVNRFKEQKEKVPWARRS